MDSMNGKSAARKIPPPDMKDEEIITSVLAGRTDDYEMLIRRYNERLYRVGISILKNDEETEDAMQETLVKAYLHLKTFKRTSQFSTWLTRIMINESLARLKQRKRLSLYSETDSDNEAEKMINLAATSQEESPEGKLLQKELHGVLEHAISQLPQRYQTIFMLREVEELSVRETAACLQISAENVKVRLHRAKELIKQNLSSVSQEMELFPFHQSRCDRIVSEVYRRCALK